MNKFLQKIYYALPGICKDIALTITLLKQKKVRYGYFYSSYLKIYQSLYLKSQAEIEEYQLAQLKKLLLECIQYSEFYRYEFEQCNVSADFIINAKSTEEILLRIPFLPKSFLKTKNSSIQNTSRSSDYENFTSGTSGTPNLIIYDKESLQIGFALWRRFHDIIGLPDKFKSVRLSGKILIDPKQKKNPFWVFNFADKQLFMSTYHLTNDNMNAYVKKLNHFQPQFIDAYPSALYVLAKFINANKSKLNFKPIAISTTAETLYEHYKLEIEKAFQCKIYNQYSSSEGGPFITECQFGKLHLNTDSGIFEFYNSANQIAKAGEYAELVITSLRQWKTPLIRYRSGDWVKVATESFSYQKCKCGCSMPIVDEIIGRQEDILFSKEKGYVGRMDPAYKGLTGIVKSKIIQHSIDTIEILNVVDEQYSKDIEKMFLNNVHDRLGNKIKIEIKIVDEIPVGASGKFKSVERKFPIP